MEPCSQATRLTNIEAAIERIEEILTEHDRALNGYGKEVGIIARVTGMAETLNELKAILKGREDDPGMVGAIRQIKESLARREDSEKWLFRLIGAYVVMELVKALLPLIG